VAKPVFYVGYTNVGAVKSGPGKIAGAGAYAASGNTARRNVNCYFFTGFIIPETCKRLIFIKLRI